MRSATLTARLRGRNQLTIPDGVVRAAGVGPGDRFIVEVHPDDPDTIHLRRVRSSYAGVLHGVYGDAAAYLDEERASWEPGGDSHPR